MTLEKAKLAELLEEVSRRGYISTKREMNIGRTYIWPRKRKEFSIGVVSDMHLCGTEQQLTLLRESYSIFKERGIKDVLNCGDLFVGSPNMHRDSIAQMFIHEGDKMVDYAVKNYPREEGIKTHIIMGNHDSSLWTQGFNDPIKAVADRRDDFNYLGMFSATVKINNINIQLLHPAGAGSIYGRSYKLQRVIEQMPGDKKPNILLMGHYHSIAILPQYRNVYGIQLPCFQTQTLFEKTKGLNPDIGAIILDIIPNTKGVFSFKVEYIPFFNTVDGDY